MLVLTEEEMGSGQKYKSKLIGTGRIENIIYTHTHKLNSLKFQEITDTWLDPKHNKYSVTEHYCVAISLSLIKKIGEWLQTYSTTLQFTLMHM